MSSYSSSEKLRCVSEWLPITWPASATAFVTAGLRRTNAPVKKNVAGTSSRSSVARMRSVAVADQPPSNVIATTRLVVGSVSQS